LITSRLKRWASAKGSLIVCDHVPRPSEDAFDAGRIGRESGDPQHLDLACGPQERECQSAVGEYSRGVSCTGHVLYRSIRGLQQCDSSGAAQIHHEESPKANHIERFNNTLRQRVSRLVRETLAFSKKVAHHIGAIRYFICHYNLTRAAALPL
jgi:IS1 transposase